MTVGAMMKSETAAPVESPRRLLYGGLLLAAVLVSVVVWPGRLIFFLLLVVSIVIHEIGHYLGARWGGMKASEFFVGFGPRIWSFRRGDTEFGIKPILLGGYVKTPGMHNLEEVAEEDESRTYRQQSYGRRVRMVFAGPLMNLAVALLGFCIYFAAETERIPIADAPARVVVAEEGVAKDVGLIDGDVIVTINGAAIDTFEDLRAQIEPNPGETFTLTVLRGAESIDFAGTIGRDKVDPSLGRLSVGWDQDARLVDRNVPEAVQRGFTEFGSQIWLQTKGIADVFSPSGIGRVFQTLTGARVDDGQRASSIVGISTIGEEAVEAGWAPTLATLALLNLALGLFNLLPILPFDGGHILIATYERFRQRSRGTNYRVDFAKVVPYFAPLIMVVLFVVMSAVILDIKAA